MPSAGPDPALVQRFRQGVGHVGRYSLRPLDFDGRFGLAVSGGPDSLALLLLATACFPGQVEAATFDHGLRAESADEARRVAAICAGLEVPHAVLTPPCPLGERDLAATERDRRGGLQALARAWRYRGLGRWCRDRGLGWLFTGHHADDQAETVLMRLARGSGPRGLAGIRPALAIDHAYAEGAREPMSVGRATVGRPLLAFAKAELVALVADCGLRAVEDPSNAAPRFDRSRARALLAETEWLDPHRLASTAAIMRDVDEALRWVVKGEWERRVDGREGHWYFDPAGLPDAILRGLCGRAILLIDDVAQPGIEPSYRGAELTRLIARLRAGGSGTLSRARARGGRHWHFTVAPPRQPVVSRTTTSARLRPDQPRPATEDSRRPS